MELIKHPEFGEIRVEVIDGEPLFCAADVCAALGFSQGAESALRGLDEDEKLMRKFSALDSKVASNRGNWFVNESGLYNLIFRSNKPDAKKFRKWVTSEVLPAIRRTGCYVNPSVGTGSDISDVAMMGYVLSRNLYDWDVSAIFRKYDLTFGQLFLIMMGAEKNNAVMCELQERALANKRRGIKAYSPDRAREVLGKLYQ